MSYQTKLRDKNRGYMNLIVWQKAMDLFDVTWRMTHIDTQIDFKLRSQLVDAAQSVSANIAEGYGRRSLPEYLQFLYVAKGSLAEALTRAIGFKSVNLFSNDGFEAFDQLHYEVENKLLRLIESLEHKREANDWRDTLPPHPSTHPPIHQSKNPSIHSSTYPSVRR